MAQASRGDEAQTAIVDAPASVVGDEKVVTSDVSEGEKISKGRGGLARESGAPRFDEFARFK